MIRPPLGRYIRYWYTYRTAVAVLIALLLTAGIYGLYTQQVACDAHSASCAIDVSPHPEDRFLSQLNADPNIVIVGIDDASLTRMQTHFPVPRATYAQALQSLEQAGAAVVAFDIAFPDQSSSDGEFASALKASTIPVVLAYGGENVVAGQGVVMQTSALTDPKGVDEIPLKQLWCSDADASVNTTSACSVPDKNVILAAIDVVHDSDGVLRRVPMFVQPTCFTDGRCTTPTINSLSFAAYRAFTLGTDFQTGPSLTESDGKASFGSAWTQPLPVDTTGSTLLNYAGGPGNYVNGGQYLSFGDVYAGSFPTDKVKGKIVLVGDYYLTAVHDEFQTPASQGVLMAGVEIHANAIQMLLAGPSRFLAPEPPLVVLLIILVLAVTTAVGVARVSVLWGLLGTVLALVAFTFAMAFVATNNSFVPDLFHPWLGIAMTYSGVTAYRFLYEDREKRKVTELFGHYLKPEIVAELAKARFGVEDILRGGERRDMSLLFVDIRGFTSMSESMAADDVVEVAQMYLDHLSGIIFTWDGTIDKYVGDEIVAFWNAPRLQPNHALLAIRCAYDLINRAPELEERLIAKGLPPIRWGIGINTGPAVVGNIGARKRIQYTALGDTVNTAARFCSHAPAFHVLIGQQTYEQCKDYIAVDLVPGVQLKGKSAETFQIYQVTAIRQTPTSPWVQFPTEMATQAHVYFTSQYSQQPVIAAAEAGSNEILVGEAAEQRMAQGQAPPD
ncbi:MAG: CHASE2 domain-containing protein [Candidatus Dormibacterales bacterium]